MRAKLIIRQHTLDDDTDVVEVWHGDEFVAAVYGLDGPGVRVISRLPLTVTERRDSLVVQVEASVTGDA